MGDAKITKEDGNILDAADLLIILEADKTNSNLSLLTTACTLIVMSAGPESKSKFLKFRFRTLPQEYRLLQLLVSFAHCSFWDTVMRPGSL